MHLQMTGWQFFLPPNSSKKPFTFLSSDKVGVFVWGLSLGTPEGCVSLSVKGSREEKGLIMDESLVKVGPIRSS